MLQILKLLVVEVLTLGDDSFASSADIFLAANFA